MTSSLTRRGAIGQSAGFAATATVVAAQETKSAAFEARPLPFDAKAIRGFSEKILTSHHQNNYGGAVRRLNAIDAELAKLDIAKAPVFMVNGLKREQLVAANSMILHELFFSSLGAGGAPAGALAAAMTRDFGSIEAWRNEFAAAGKALGGGSGWVLLSYSPRLGRLANQWAADHTMTLADGFPLLALDMYEHAYHMDFGAAAGAYVDAFMAVIDWTSTEARFTAAVKRT